jgi:pentatricopeptide repeat domain-containing protein 1
LCFSFLECFISACGPQGKWENALKFLEGSAGLQLTPDVYSYNAAINACAKGGQWDKSLQLLEDCERKGIEPDLVTFNSVIGACAVGKQWEKALELLDLMQTRGVKPNVITLNAAISACEKAGQPQKAFELTQRWKAVVYSKGGLDEERIQKLEELGFVRPNRAKPELALIPAVLFGGLEVR